MLSYRAMPTTEILEALVAERDRIEQAIAIFQGTPRHRGRPPGSSSTNQKTTATPKARTMSAAAKKRHSQRMKAYWAARRKAAKEKTKSA